MNRGLAAALALAGFAVCHAAEPKVDASADPGANVRQQLRTTFDKLLTDPAAYRQRALGECANFPEGRVYPFLFPALGYANLALRGDMPREEAAARMRPLIDLAIPEVASVVGAPKGDLLALYTYRRHATFLSILNFALGNYALLSSDGRYADLQNHLSRLLFDALEAAPGQPVSSYPEYTWYFDTIMTFASLYLWRDEQAAPRVRELFRKYLAWREATIRLPTGLPRACPEASSRGCDLSMQVCLLANMDPGEARRLYKYYVAAHWINAGPLGGFAEWPPGTQAPAQGDVDSGPIVMGIGATASGLGIGAALAAGDVQRANLLINELGLAASLIHGASGTSATESLNAWAATNASLASTYTTGFLYGDAALFYALTWAPFPAPAPR